MTIQQAIIDNNPMELQLALSKELSLKMFKAIVGNFYILLNHLIRLTVRGFTSDSTLSKSGIIKVHNIYPHLLNGEYTSFGSLVITQGKPNSEPICVNLPEYFHI